MVYNILALFSDLTNPPAQYSIYVENRLYCMTLSSFGRPPASFCCLYSSLFENLHYLRTEPSHCQDFDHLVVYFNRKCTHVTAYETDAMKRLLDLSHTPRGRG